MNFKQLLSKHTLLAAITIGCTSLPALAQPPVTTASSTTPANTALRLCPPAVCTTDQLELLAKPARINADMITIIQNPMTGEYTKPGELGVNSGYTQLFGVAYSGIDNTDLPAGYSGFTINTHLQQTGGTPPTGDAHELPYWGLGLTGTVTDADIALGSDNVVASIGLLYSHFAIVVYAMNDVIYAEKYIIHVGTGGIVTVDPVPNTGGASPCTPSGGPVFPCTGSPFVHTIVGNYTLNDINYPLHPAHSQGSNTRPQIDLWHIPGVVPTTGDPVYHDHYIVVWQKMNISTGNSEIWAMTGDMDFTTINNPFFVGFGTHADVVAVSDFATGTNTEHAYISYIDANGELVVAHTTYGLGTTAPTSWSNPVYTPASGNIISYPRIAGPKRYDFSNPGNEPLGTVVMNEYINNIPIDAVTAVKVYHNSISATPDDETDITSAGSPGFSNSGTPVTAIMPVVSGVGDAVSSPGAGLAYNDYPVEFYSDYTNGSGSNGDYYAFGIPLLPGSGSITPNNTYMEVNVNAIDYTGGTCSMGDLPAFAASTANNTGYDMVSAFFGGDNSGGRKELTVAFNNTGTPYNFKPGHPATIGATEDAGFATYPNPVKDVLNVTQAGGATYTVTNALGQLLNFGTLSGDKAKVGTSALMPGTYILTISKDGHTEKVKFTKQ